MIKLNNIPILNRYNIGERNVKIYSNIFSTFFYKGFSILISLILVPLTLHYVDNIRYGIWITLSSILTWLNFFDMGFGNGLRNRLAEAIANGKYKLARIYVSTTYAILTIIISIVLVIFLITNSLINWTKVLNSPTNFAHELSILALIVFIFFCLQFILQLINIVLTADQHPAKASFFNLLGSVFSLIAIFLLTKFTKGSLLYLGCAFSAAPVLVLLLSSIWFYKKDYKHFSPSYKYVKFKYTKNLMSLGAKFFLIQVAAIIIYQTSNIIIAQICGPQNVTSYNIAFRYFGVITMLFSIIMTPYWSAYTEAYTKRDWEWMKKTALLLKKIWFLFFIGILVMFAFSGFIYHLWIGDMVVIPLNLSIAVALYVIINAWCSIFSFILNGLGKIKLQFYYNR